MRSLAVCMRWYALAVVIFVFSVKATSEHIYKWAVIGFGPAGMITAGLLLDLGVAEKDIIAIDPEFNVGRLGEYYSSVPSNTKTKLFIDFIKACKVFQECNSEAIEKLYTYDMEVEYPLQIIVDPLKDITAHLRTKIDSLQDSIQSLYFDVDAWHITTASNSHLIAENVVLAIGSHPRCLNYDCTDHIPLDVALNKDLLSQAVGEKDSVAVIGGAHSAVLIMKFLSELKVKRVINFYQNPLQYVVDGMLSINGLKGVAAQWAKEVLEKNPPVNMIRVYNNQEGRDAWLDACNKIIYAIGYERNEAPTINGNNVELSYDGHSGVIAPRLFGIGIAFPEQYASDGGAIEHKIGLNSFMSYAQRVIPEWLAKDRSRFFSFDQLFTINMM
ncbi:MAG: FAD-dependent oxidoreductase [Candidatus Dependentiae bacterium]|nr:FAD-dependent oxidoreductase [Candidatus Dependentiae bacterium]